MKTRTYTALFAAAVMIALVATVVALTALGSVANIAGGVGPQGSTRISLTVIVFGALVMLALLYAFVYILVEDLRSNRPISGLLMPMLAAKAAMTCYMMPLGAQALDLLSHGLRPHWSPLYTPGLRIVQNVFLLLVFVSFAWVLGVVLSFRGWIVPRILLLCAAIALAAGALIALVTLLADHQLV